MSLTDKHGIATKRQHGLKADGATGLHKQGVLRHDFGPLLKDLNQARKDIWYEGDEPELDQSLEDTLADVEILVAEAEAQA